MELNFFQNFQGYTLPAIVPELYVLIYSIIIRGFDLYKPCLIQRVYGKTLIIEVLIILYSKSSHIGSTLMLLIICFMISVGKAKNCFSLTSIPISSHMSPASSSMRNIRTSCSYSNAFLLINSKFRNLSNEKESKYF